VIASSRSMRESDKPSAPIADRAKGAENRIEGDALQRRCAPCAHHLRFAFGSGGGPYAGIARPYHLSESSPAMNANRSQSTCERVSVRGDKICRERVCASQRPGGVLAPRFVLSQRRDGNRRSGLRDCRRKPGVLSETTGNRICAGLGGGGGSPDRTSLRVLFPANREKNREFRENRPTSLILTSFL
jgi:hypothetical protein